MGYEVGGVAGLLHLIIVVWVAVSTGSSTATTGAKVFWIVLVILLPLIGLILWLLFGPKSVRRV